MRWTSTNELLSHAAVKAAKVSETLASALDNFRQNRSHSEEGDHLLAAAHRAASEVAATLKTSVKEQTHDRPIG